MTDGRNALTWGMFEPDPRNVLNASEPTQADAYSYNAPVVRDAWAAAQDPQTWQDAAQQYGQGLLAGSVTPGAKGMALDPAAMKVLREMTPGFRAYHGSPHSFDAFDSAKIGTGEGAQAYGHGLYLADSEGVARSYRDALAPGQKAGWAADVQYAPGALKDIQAGPMRVPDLLSDAMDKGARDVGSGGSADATAKAAVARLRQWQASDAAEAAKIKGPNADIYKSRLADYDAAIGHIESGRVSGTPIAGLGHMYEVQVNAHPAHFLDWDKPLSEQSPHVQQALKSIGVDPGTYSVRATDAGHVVDYTDAHGAAKTSRAFPSADAAHSAGKATMQMMDRDPAGSQIVQNIGRWASDNPQAFPDMRGYTADLGPLTAERLQSAGIPGIRYLDGGSRADGSGTSNHVIFDANTIAILRKYGIAGLIAGGGAAAAGNQSGTP